MPKLARQGKKTKARKKVYSKDELWIAPSSSLKRPVLQSDWKLPRVEPPESNRFLELADVALGLSTTGKRKRKAAA
jgi:hypothetical protein